MLHIVFMSSSRHSCLYDFSSNIIPYNLHLGTNLAIYYEIQRRLLNINITLICYLKLWYWLQQKINFLLFSCSWYIRSMLGWIYSSNQFVCSTTCRSNFSNTVSVEPKYSKSTLINQRELGTEHLTVHNYYTDI